MSDETSRRGLRSLMRADIVDVTSTVERSPIPVPEVQPAEGDDSEVFDPSSGALHRSLPPDSALLSVTEDTTPGSLRHFRLGFYFDGRYEESRDEDVRVQTAVDLSLHRIAERGTWKEDHDELKHWWQELARLRRWMNRLAETTDARLIVWDNTNFQLPWELYHVAEQPDGTPSGWLGAMVEVVRWTSLLETGRETLYTAAKSGSTGSVLVLETEDITAQSDGIATLAEDYGPPPVRDMDTLLGELNRNDLRLGLVLVHCHGVNATNANEFRLAERTLNEIEDSPMAALKHSEAVVILNACNTAKIVPVGPHAHRATRSFAEMFLRKGASSVIATLGKVGLDHTHEFTFQLLNATDDDRRISRFLMHHRRTYVQRLADPTRDDARYEQFFYSFMYVCFGHPDTTLEVTQSTPGGER